MLAEHRSINNIFFSKFNLVPFIVIVLYFLNSMTASLTYFILALYALGGKHQVIQALAITWFFNMVNSNIVPYVEFKSLGRYLVIFFCFFPIFFNFDFKKVDKTIFLTLLLGLFFLIHSIIFSRILDVSVLKSINWIMVILSSLIAFSKLNQIEFDYIKRWLIGFLVIISLFSLIFIFSKEIGYSRSGSGFQGILSHPQVFGPTIALLAAFLIGKLFEKHSISLTTLLVLLFYFILVLLSESRTAGFAVVIVFLIIIFYTFISSNNNKIQYSASDRTLRFLLFITIIFFYLLTDYYYFNYINYFISKSGQAEVDGVISAYKVSRGVLYDPMINNIKENLFSGIGFGIASNLEEMVIRRDPLIGLPFSAATEKGITPIMILEEVGLFGFIFFIIWIWHIVKSSIFNGIIAFSILLANLAESTLFSPGGAGLINIIFISLVCSKNWPKTNLNNK